LDSKVKKIVLLGASSSLARYLAGRFLQMEIEVYGFVRSSTASEVKQELRLKGVNVIEFSEYTPAMLVKMSPQVVINCISCYEVNENTTIEDLVSIPFHFINTGTSLPSTVNTYAYTKECLSLCLEKLFNQASASVLCTDLAIHIIVDPESNSNRFPLSLAKAIACESRFFELTSGFQARDFCHIEDVFSCLIFFMERDCELPYLRFELGTGTCIPIKEFCERLKDEANSEIDLRFGENRLRESDPLVQKANVKLLRDYGWTHQHSIKNIISDLAFGIGKKKCEY
jgi:nucleoside-diphosphate-sugar epimerase